MCDIIHVSRAFSNSTYISFLFSGIDCFKPANGETVVIETQHNIPVDISLNLLKREASFKGLCGN